MTTPDVISSVSPAAPVSSGAVPQDKPRAVPQAKPNPVVFFIAAQSPADPDKLSVDYSVAYGNGRAAIEGAKASAKAKYGEQCVVRVLADDKVGVFIDVAGDLALLFVYTLKPVELRR